MADFSPHQQQRTPPATPFESSHSSSSTNAPTNSPPSSFTGAPLAHLVGSKPSAPHSTSIYPHHHQPYNFDARPTAPGNPSAALSFLPPSAADLVNGLEPLEASPPSDSTSPPSLSGVSSSAPSPELAGDRFRQLGRITSPTTPSIERKRSNLRLVIPLSTPQRETGATERYQELMAGRLDAGASMATFQDASDIRRSTTPLNSLSYSRSSTAVPSAGYSDGPASYRYSKAHASSREPRPSSSMSSASTASSYRAELDYPSHTHYSSLSSSSAATTNPSTSRLNAKIAALKAAWQQELDLNASLRHAVHSLTADHAAALDAVTADLAAARIHRDRLQEAIETLLHEREMEREVHEREMESVARRMESLRRSAETAWAEGHQRGWEEAEQRFRAETGRRPASALGGLAAIGGGSGGAFTPAMERGNVFTPALGQGSVFTPVMGQGPLFTPAMGGSKVFTPVLGGTGRWVRESRWGTHTSVINAADDDEAADGDHFVQAEKDAARIAELNARNADLKFQKHYLTLQVRDLEHAVRLAGFGDSLSPPATAACRFRRAVWAVVAANRLSLAVANNSGSAPAEDSAVF